jgi:hypothetical protein
MSVKGVMSGERTGRATRGVPPTVTGRVLWSLTVLGGCGVAATPFAAGAARFWANWMLWFLYLLTLALGALFLVALEHLVSARWSVPLRRIPERVASLLLPLVAVGAVALGALPVLFPGARAEAAADPHLAGKAFWLGVPFFSARVMGCLLLGLLPLWVLVRGSLRQDLDRDPAFTVRARRFAPACMAIFALLVTEAAFDWIGGLEPEWYSDVIGVYLFAGAFLAGLATTTLAVLYLKGRGRLGDIRFDHLYNLGGFLFGFTVFWSYIAFAQYMLMWYANLPDEVHWYQARIQGAWLGVALLLAVLHFLVPFGALVTRDAKGDPGRLRWVAVVLLAAHWLDLYWLIFPQLGRTPLGSWPELSFALLFGGGTVLWLRGAMEKGEDMPVGDPFLGEGLEFRL